MRHQKGSIILRSGSWYCRAYVNKKQKNFFLALKDDKHHSAKCKPVQLLKDDVMAKVNALSEQSYHLTCQQVWDTIYLPFITGDLKPSTVKAYSSIWRQFLADELGPTQPRDYETEHASAFLTKLTKSGLGRRTVSHVRALMVAFFGHCLAIPGKLVSSNVIREAKVLCKTKPPTGTDHYTLEQVEDCISLLKDHPDCQLVFSLGFFQGLRPSEIAALQLSDFSQDFVHVRRAIVWGIVGTCKTPESVADVPLTEMTKVFLKLHVSKNQPQKWLFENRDGNPIILDNLVKRTIRPILGSSYKPLYCLRRGGATALVEMSGNLVGAKGLLRHKSVMTTAQFYVRETPLETIRQVKQLEAKTQEK